jgi:hypothetical protein
VADDVFSMPPAPCNLTQLKQNSFVQLLNAVFIGSMGEHLPVVAVGDEDVAAGVAGRMDGLSELGSIWGMMWMRFLKPAAWASWVTLLMCVSVGDPAEEGLRLGVALIDAELWFIALWMR